MFKANPIAILTLAGLTAAGSVCGCRAPRNNECCDYCAAQPVSHQELREPTDAAANTAHPDDLPPIDSPGDLRPSDAPPDAGRQEVAGQPPTAAPKPQANPYLEQTPGSPEQTEPQNGEAPEVVIDSLQTPESAPADGNPAADGESDPIADLQKLGAEIEFADNGSVDPGDRDPGSVIGVDLSGASLTDDDLRVLGRFPNLQKLDLSNTQISDAALKHLSDQCPLQLLWLNYTQVTDEGLAHVADLTTLKSLGLTGTRIRDNGLAHLTRLNELEYLLLSQNEITDAGLEHLTALGSLEGISLIRTRVTREGVGRLKQALPNCQIVADAAKEQQQDARPPVTAPPVLPAPEAADEQNDIDNELQSLRAVPVIEAIVQGVRHPRKLAVPAEAGRILAGAADPEAQQKLLKLLRVLLSDPLALNRLGKHYLADSRWEEALTVFDAAMLIAPNETTVRYHLAVAAARLGDVETAMPHFIETVGPAAAHYNVGVILYDAGRLAESQQQLEQAVHENPDLEVAKTWLNDVRRERIARLIRTERRNTLQANQKARRVF